MAQKEKDFVVTAHELVRVTYTVKAISPAVALKTARMVGDEVARETVRCLQSGERVGGSGGPDGMDGTQVWGSCDEVDLTPQEVIVENRQTIWDTPDDLRRKGLV
jgi:hypothetical protein